MSTDRELLEMAAKAAGKPMEWDGQVAVLLAPDFKHDESSAWNPLRCDGDEARLEAKLRLRVIWYGNCVSVGHDGSGAIEFFQDHGGDEQAARRYAGVRAAAAIGEKMP